MAKKPAAKKTFVRPDYIASVQDIKTEDVRVPQWDSLDVEAWVRVRGMTGIERDDWEAEMMPDPQVASQMKNMTPQQRRAIVRQRMQGARARLVARCCVDEDGNRIFSNKDVEMLAQKSAAALDRIYEVAARLSGIREDDIEELAEAVEGNLGDDSSSGSA